MKLLTAAVAVASVALAVVPASPAATPTQHIEVTATVRQKNVAVLPPVGRAGDAESAHWIVRDQRGDAIGDMLIECRWVTSGLRLCVGQLSMPLGTIALVGASRTRFIGQLAVVGGTGRYIGANGTMLFRLTDRARYTLSVEYTLQR